MHDSFRTAMISTEIQISHRFSLDTLLVTILLCIPMALELSTLLWERCHSTLHLVRPGMASLKQSTSSYTPIKMHNLLTKLNLSSEKLSLSLLSLALFLRCNCLCISIATSNMVACLEISGTIKARGILPSPSSSKGCYYVSELMQGSSYQGLHNAMSTTRLESI